MRVFTAGVKTETNTFSPLPTGLREYEDHYLTRGGVSRENLHLAEIPANVWRRRCEERGWELVQSLLTASAPAAPTARAVWEGFREEILADLRRAMPVDIVILNLHGAMVAVGYDDCEGDLLAAVRGVVGPDIPVGAELDAHTQLTEQMTTHADALVIYKEYPHTDFADRAEELFTILADRQAGRTRPHMAVFDCRMIDFFFTTVEPMRGFVASMKALEEQPGVLSISCCHGFPYGDVPECTAKMLVVTDDRPAQGAALARELGMELISMRGRTGPPFITVDEALAQAARAAPGPVVLADIADNAGAGAPSDSTSIIRALLDQGADNAAVALLWDPGAVALAHAAGIGATLRMRLGEKVDPNGPPPLDLEVTVTALVREATMGYCCATLPMGDLATLRCGGVEIVANTYRTQARSLDCFLAAGIDPRQKRILVVKSINHFRAAFEPIASEVLYVGAPGTLNPNLAQLPYRRVRRPIWPLDDNAFDFLEG